MRNGAPGGEVVPPGEDLHAADGALRRSIFGNAALVESFSSMLTAARIEPLFVPGARSWITNPDRPRLVPRIG